MTRASMYAGMAGVAGMLVLAGGTASATSFTATGTGPITAYFVGQTAGYGSDIGLWVNGVAQNIYGLQNHSSTYGQSLVLGNANAGDTLVFELRVSMGNGSAPPPISDLDYSLFSDPARNTLDSNFEHTVASAFAGDGTIPAGTKVGFEDILGGGDLDFDDHLFVFTGVTNTTPDGGSTLLLAGLGLLGFSLLRRRLT